MNHRVTLVLLISSLMCCAHTSVAAQIGQKRKRSGQQNLRIVYKDNPKMYAVAAKLTKTSLGIFNNIRYPLVDIIVQYAFDPECVVVCERIQEHHGTGGVELFRRVMTTVNNMFNARATFKYFNSEVIINHSRYVSDKEIACVTPQSDCGWSLEVVSGYPGKTVLTFRDYSFRGRDLCELLGSHYY